MRSELSAIWESLKRLLNIAGDLIALNLLMILCCVPVLTAGAAEVACYSCLLRILREGDTGLPFQHFWGEFRKSFRQATFIWMLLLLCFVILAGDFYFAVYASVPTNQFFLYFSVILAVVLGLAATWVFPLQARYSNTLGGHVKNAFLLALARLPRTLLALAVQVLTVALPLLFPFLAVYFGWLWLMFGFSLPMYLTAKLYRKQLSSEPQATETDIDTDEKG